MTAKTAYTARMSTPTNRAAPATAGHKRDRDSSYKHHGRLAVVKVFSPILKSNSGKLLSTGSLCADDAMTSPFFLPGKHYRGSPLVYLSFLKPIGFCVLSREIMPTPCSENMYGFDTRILCERGYNKVLSGLVAPPTS